MGRGRVERSVPAGFSASETFDIGIDLGSPVSLDYHERAPFAFNGKIHKIHFRYVRESSPPNRNRPRIVADQRGLGLYPALIREYPRKSAAE